MHPTRDHISALPPIAMVGSGRVGGALARAAAANGVAVTLVGRGEPEATLQAAEVTLLCVPDDEIEAACMAVTAAAPRTRFVGHTSGATGLDALAAARNAGSEVFSLHPLQTVPDREAEVVGAPAAIAGSSDEALDLSRRLAATLGMKPFELPEDARSAYHAAACIASNFLVTLEQSAAALLGAAGVEDGRALLTPLVLRTAANWAERGGKALTGPIARGDEATIATHLEAIRERVPELEPLYRELAERTRALAAAGEGVGA